MIDEGKKRIAHLQLQASTLKRWYDESKKEADIHLKQYREVMSKIKKEQNILDCHGKKMTVFCLEYYGRSQRRIAAVPTKKKLLEIMKTTWHMITTRAFVSTIDESDPTYALAVKNPCTVFFSDGNLSDPESYKEWGA